MLQGHAASEMGAAAPSGPRRRRLRLLAAGAALLLMTIALVGGCGKVKTADEYVRDAQARRAAGDLPAALIDLKNALQKEPRNAATRLMLGRFYLEVPDPASAEAELLRARLDGASPPEVAEPLAEAELFLGKPEAALKETAELDGVPTPLKVRLMAERAQALMALGRMDEAKKVLEAGLAEDGRSVAVLTGMIRYALAAHDLPAARGRLAEAKEIAPGNVAVFSLEGAVTFATGDFAASELAFRHMRDAAPWNLSTYLGMARAEIAQDKLDEAEKNLAVVLKAAPADPNANYLSALASYRRQDYAKAQFAIQRTLNAAKEFAPALLLAGASSLALKQYEQANTYLGHYVYLVPENLQARKLLATVQLQLGYADEAVKTLASIAARGSDDAEMLGLIGVAAARNGDLAAADRYLQMALSRQPSNTALRAQLGIAELALGRTDVGIEDLERATTEDPSAQRPELVLFATYLRDGQFDKAIDVAERLKKAHADDAAGYDLAGLAYLAKRDNDSARAQLEDARRLRRGDPLALRLLAGISVQDGKLDTARQYLQEILDANPKDVQAHLGLAELDIQEEHPERAEAMLEQAVRLAPDSAPARLMLGRLLLVSGRSQDALGAVEPVLAQAPQYPGLLEVAGQAELAMKDPQAATSTFKTLVEIQPDASLAHRYLAQAYGASGDIDLTLEEARKAVELAPKDAAAKSLLARAYLPKGDFAAAQTLADDLAAERPDDPAVAELQGQIAVATGRPQDAVAAFQRALALADNGFARIRLAHALQLGGSLDRAEETLLPWVTAHPDDAAVRLSLGDIYLAAHRLDDAVGQYRAVAERYPDNVAAHNNLAWILSIKGNRKEALEHAQHAANLAPSLPEVLDTLGVVLMQNERASDALSALQGASARAPANLQIKFHLAQALAQTGAKDRARDILRTLLASGPFSDRDEAQKLLESLGS